MRTLLACLVLVSFVFVACRGGGGGGDDTAQTKALQAAMELFGDDPGTIPPINQDAHCEITVRQPVRAGTTPPPPVPGICNWTMTSVGDTWFITFSETWDCAAFNVEADGYPACSGATGTHSWDFLVDGNLVAMQLADHGHFAPDIVIPN